MRGRRGSVSGGIRLAAGAATSPSAASPLRAPLFALSRALFLAILLVLSRALFLAILLASPAARAHEVLHAVERADAVVVTLEYGDRSPFAFEGYEIYFEDEPIPAQVGRTDGRGRVAFLPDRSGRWRIKAFSEDGHGADFAFDADARTGASRAGGSAFERYGRLLAGIAILFGLFGLLQLFYRRRRT